MKCILFPHTGITRKNKLVSKVCFFAILFACILPALHAGDITVRQIPVAKELPSNTVYRMFQDKEGYVWFGTMNGFCRYDGYGMKSFRNDHTNPSFTSNSIIGGFAEDTLNHVIWVGTEKGVLIVDKRTHVVTPLDTALLNDSPIRQILYTDKKMWVCSDLGLYLYNTDRTLIKKYLAEANSIHVDNQGIIRVTVWEGGMFYLDRTTDTFLPYPRIGPRNNPHKIFEDKAGRFWICTWSDGLFRFYPNRQGQTMYEPVNMPDDNKSDLGIFFDIEQDDVNGYLWALSYSGVTVFQPDSKRFTSVDELTAPINELTNLFSDIMKDRDGNIWLGTYNQGAIVINPSLSSVTNLDLESIKSETAYLPNITRVFEDRDGEFWMRQSRVGLFLLNREHMVIRRLEIPEINAANAICNNKEMNEIWIAVDFFPSTIHRVQKRNGKVSLLGSIDMHDILGEETEIVKYLHEDRYGAVWAATSNFLLRWWRGQWRTVSSDCGDITGITEDRNGTIWVGSSKKGLWRFSYNIDAVEIDNYNSLISCITSDNITCINAGDKQVWFCVNDKQLWSYDIEKQEIQDYTQNANVNNHVIQDIIIGDNGHVWFSGNKQVVEFNPLTGASTQYDAEQDLIVTSLNINSITKANDGSVIFGGNRGLCIFTPSPQLTASDKKVKTLVTDVKINNGSVFQNESGQKIRNLGNELVLFPYETNLEIDFSSFNYLNPGKTRYAYKLEGIDNQWIISEPERNFAVYNQLRKGKYTFLVKSSGDNQLWSDEITRLVIIKKPAFYETGWAYAGYTCLIGIFLFVVLRFYAIRIKLHNELHITQMEKMKSNELIQTKISFFTNIGHEFRTPLTLIMTPLSVLIHQLTDENMKQKLSSIYRNAEDMLGLVNQLLDFRKLESGSEKLKLTCDDFVKFIEYIYLTFKDIALNKSIRFTFESDFVQLYMGFDKSKVRKILNNMYANALKFTSEDGYIATSIRLIPEKGREFVILEIADSGCGIPEKEQKMIFNRFFQSENNDAELTGSGIGLHLVKEYVELHGGQITVSSKIGEGSVFTISIPTDLSIPEKNETPVDEPLSLDDKGFNDFHKEQKTLLIVEDNAELRRFLAEQFGSKFNVLQATEGKQGLSIALGKSPDLIVSDLMMPVLNGIEMCRQLKNDINTSHIPIILLTAKASDETKIDSYKAGADSYIAKPFNIEVLLTRIEALIEQQEKRRSLFHKTIEITPSVLTTTSLDEELIKKALLAVEKNMDNTKYSVDELASELAFSRRQLSRKFQSIIGLSPGEFIRSVRLKRAAQLLKDSRYPISEISDRVGFSTVKYFNLYFKEEFGVTPTLYRTGERANG